MKNQGIIIVSSIILFICSHSSIAQGSNFITIADSYPWCIVAYDSLERSPTDRIRLIKDLGFDKYAYDWRDQHLDDTYEELKLARENDIQIIGIWFWLNAKRDRLGRLSMSNKRILKAVKKLKLKTTFWLSFNDNFFQDQNQDQAIITATKMIAAIAKKTEKMSCKIALYNHSGWFGNPYNQLAIIKALPHLDLRIVYNFHHFESSLDEFPKMVKAILPYLTAVNLNGVQKNSKKILTIGKGAYEKEMIEILQHAGYNGPWGILGHVENMDVRKVLKQNLEGLKAMQNR